jgi:protein tyrosine phosphatase type 4A
MRYNLFTESQRNFIISESPADNNIEEYIKILQKNSINLVINLTNITEKNTYDIERIKNANIDYLHFPLQDGTIPSDTQIYKLMEFLNRYNSIAFHCTAGLGRAPMMFAISYIILFNKKPLDCIEMIRQKEPKALNNIQIKYLCNFKRKKYKNDNCIIT